MGLQQLMAEIEESVAGLPVLNVYGAQPPQVDALGRDEMCRRRTAEGRPKIVGKEVN